MLGGLLGGKFSNKCKHGVKCIRTRMVSIRNRKQSVVRILRKDIADLLTAGHDRDAFRRIDVLLVEINHRACYDMIEKFCEFLLTQLPSMQKQSGECPREVTETMATLIFAAARFADLPELCDLRLLFIQRYGSDMQSFVNAEFVDKIQIKTFPIEKKLQLMKDIADEFSIKWDSNSFNHELSTSPALKFNQSKVSMSSKVGEPLAMPCEPKEISSREGLHFTTADAAREEQILMPNDALVFSAAKIKQLYDPKMRTRKVAAYESVTADMYEEEDRIHHDLNSRSNNVRKHDDGKPKSGIWHSRKADVENEKQYCIDSEVQRVRTLKSLNDEPDNLLTPCTKSNGNKTGYNIIEGTALPRLYAKVDRPKNAFPVLKRSPSNLENSRLASVEGGLGPVREDLKQVRSEKKGLLANMNPPYVKLKDRGAPAQIDPLNSDSVDHVRSNETGARCNGNDDNERPRPFSVKKNFHSGATIETDDNAIDVEKLNLQDASPDDRRRDKSNRRTSGYGNNADYDEDNATSRASKSPIHGEMADVLVYGRQPLPRTSSVERRHGNRSSAVMHDRMENDENSYGKHDTHPSGVGRNHRSKQGNGAYAGIYSEERITGSNGSKQRLEDELDNAVDYGNLFRRTSHGQREHRSARHPAAVHHVFEYEYDEQEMAMDRLPTHLSRKGTTEVQIKDRRTRIVAGNHAVDGD